MQRFASCEPCQVNKVCSVLSSGVGFKDTCRQRRAWPCTSFLIIKGLLHLAWAGDKPDVKQ